MQPIQQEAVLSAEASYIQLQAEAERRALETLEPFVERTSLIKEYVGVELREPLEVRRDTPLPEGLYLLSEIDSIPRGDDATSERYVVLTPNGEAKIRANASEIGIGMTDNLTLERIGMSEDAQVNLEGGRIFTKLRAELDMVLESGTGSVVATLTRHRKLDDTDKERTRANLNVRATEAVATGEDASRAFALRGEAVCRHIESLHMLGAEMPGFVESTGRDPLTGNGRAVGHILEFLKIDPTAMTTEYDGGVIEIMGHPDFMAFDEPMVKGYVNSKGEHLPSVSDSDNAGALIAIGTIGGREVYIQEVSRQYFAEDGQPAELGVVSKKYVQPNAGQLLRATASLIGSESAAIATSNTYFPSRVIDVTQAIYDETLDMVSPNRHYGAIAYSPSTLARVQGIDEPEIISMGHLLGEVQWTDKKIHETAATFQRERR
jgi:hypothetical protein